MLKQCKTINSVQFCESHLSGQKEITWKCMVRVTLTSCVCVCIQNKSQKTVTCILSVSLPSVFAATTPSATSVPASGPGPACDPAAPGPHPSHPAHCLLQLWPALPLLHPGQLLPRPGPGGEGGQGPGRRRESSQRRRWGQVRLVQTQRGGLEEGEVSKKRK